MTPALTIRPAGVEDASVIAGIYNHYVEHSTATFDTEPKTAEEHAAWLAEHGDEYPVVVAERGGAVAGWGSLSRWASRCAWRHTVEVSIYVDSDARGSGLGSAIMADLLRRAEALGHHALIGQVVAENEASIALSERHGFERVGLMREVGRKFDRWLDLVLMERIVGNRTAGR
jgi:L-amino acid N-acyltransferase YncA